MTREEAIEMWVIPALKNSWNEEKCAEILKALDQEPVFFPPCQDCNTKMDEIRRAYDKLQKQELCDDEYIKVPKKALKYRTAGMIAYNAEWLKNHFDMERAVICGEQEPCDAVSRDSVLNTLENMDKALDTQRTIESYKELLVECMKELPSVHPKSIECEDVISRKLLKASLVFDNKTSNMQVAEMRKIFEIIDALPSVHPECTEDYCPVAFKPVECEDCVSRKALLKIYDDRFLELQKIKHLKDNKGAEDRQMGVNYCINILKEMPSVNPAEKVGHWIYIGNSEVNGLKICKCSNCKKKTYGSHKFCPNCGTKMREVKE